MEKERRMKMSRRKEEKIKGMKGGHFYFLFYNLSSD